MGIRFTAQLCRSARCSSRPIHGSTTEADRCGYHYSDNFIYGFSHTHLSGTGIPDYCDVLLAPYISTKDFLDAGAADNLNGYASKFSRPNEKAEPGYYAVKLDDENITAEMTAITHTSFQRYNLPQTASDAKFTIDLKS